MAKPPRREREKERERERERERENVRLQQDVYEGEFPLDIFQARNTAVAPPSHSPKRTLSGIPLYTSKLVVEDKALCTQLYTWLTLRLAAGTMIYPLK